MESSKTVINIQKGKKPWILDDMPQLTGGKRTDNWKGEKCHIEVLKEMFGRDAEKHQHCWDVMCHHAHIRHMKRSERKQQPWDSRCLMDFVSEEIKVLETEELLGNMCSIVTKDKKIIIQIWGESTETFYNILFVVEPVATCSVNKLHRAKKCRMG